jgi:transglutaminase-like putative cysteine protease
MKLAIRHETLYRYSSMVTYTIQLLRLTPRGAFNQHLLDWNIESPGRRNRHVDAYGNVTHTLVVSEPHTSVRLVAHGTVDVAAVHRGRVEDDVGIPVQAFLVDTPLTTADDAVRDLAHGMLPRGMRGGHDALTLACAIRDRVAYESGVTEVSSTATQALALGRGVCQDHAHLFLAASRELGVPARYVSGYIHPGDTAHVASHAWAEVWFPREKWVSVDITNGSFASEKHCRVAVGRDYDSACPVRGLRTGGGHESMDVNVTVTMAES